MARPKRKVIAASAVRGPEGQRRKRFIGLRFQVGPEAANSFRAKRRPEE